MSRKARLRRFCRDHGLTLVLFLFFFASFAGQALSGHRVYNLEQREHSESQVTFFQYLHTNDFWELTFENWESEFLQMGAFVFLTTFFFQRGSSQSKDPDHPEKSEPPPRPHHHAPGPVFRGGWQLAVYRRSLTLALFGLFIFCFAGHAIFGAGRYTEGLKAHGVSIPPGFGAWPYLRTSHFWMESFQNWQSEFLSVGVFILLTIWLRQEGSPESKPVDAPHWKTGD